FVLHTVSLLVPPPPASTLFPYTTLFRSRDENRGRAGPFSPDQLRIVFECAVGRKRFGVYFVPVQGTASLGWGSVCAGKGNDTGRIAFLFHAAELLHRAGSPLGGNEPNAAGCPDC